MMTPPEASTQNRLTEAVGTYGRQLFRFIRGRVRNDADAEDILQDVWYQLGRVWALEPIEHLSGWLYRVARNRLNDGYRRKKPVSIDDLAPGEDADGENIVSALLEWEAESPETELLRQTIWEALFNALEELPEPQRTVFILNELEGETFQSIADRTGENIKTLISRKRYAVQHLRERLQGLYQDFIQP
jgi:RNA polymerase sigma factor (sigma-70 family)